MGKTLTFAAAVIAFLAWRFIIGPQMAANDATWDDARPALAAKFTRALGEGMRLDADSEAGRDIVTCMTLKATAFLNTTNCTYAYNESTTSRDRHLATQRACLKSVRYDEHETVWALDCLQEHGPDDWSFYRGIIAAQVEGASAERGMDPKQAAEMGECMGEKLALRLQQTGCKPLNRDATKAAEVLRLDACMEDEAVAKDFRDLREACAPSTTLVPTLPTPAALEAAPTGKTTEKTDAEPGVDPSK